MKVKTGLALFVAIVFQFLILSAVYVNAALPLWNGTEIKLRTVPVDPRSMFRGNYVQLRYDISRLDENDLVQKRKLRNGEIVYTVLQRGQDNFFKLSHATLEKPAGGVYLRGRTAFSRPHRRGEELRC